jgi:hypothetical protein
MLQADLHMLAASSRLKCRPLLKYLNFFCSAAIQKLVMHLCHDILHCTCAMLLNISKHSSQKYKALKLHGWFQFVIS